MDENGSYLDGIAIRPSVREGEGRVGCGASTLFVSRKDLILAIALAVIQSYFLVSKLSVNKLEFQISVPDKSSYAMALRSLR